MPRDRAARTHLSPDVLLDLLEDRLSAPSRRDAEFHLGLPCPDCLERLRTLGALITRMRSDRLEAVPADLHERALAAFGDRPVEVGAASGVGRWLALAFDSRRDPALAGARRSVGEALRLRFEHEALTLELECEAESASQFSLRGRLQVADPELHRVEVAIGVERAECWADGDGAFHFEGLPRGEVRLAVQGPLGPFDAPAFTL